MSEDVKNSQTTPTQPTTPPNAPIVMKVDSGVVMMSSLPSKKPEFHWTKTELKAVGKAGGLIVFASGKLETLYVSLKKLEGAKGSDTYENVLAALKGQSAAPLHVQWTTSDDGRKFILKVLNEAQYKAALGDMNRHRKMMRHGFQTQNAWMS